MSSTQRNIVRKQLTELYNKKDGTNIENNIYNMCVKLSETYANSTDDIYTKMSYEKIGELIANPDRKYSILADINNNLIGWDTDAFRSLRDREKRETQTKIAGPQLKSGEFKCKNKLCGSDKCYYHQIQTRSCDEAPTTYVVCSICGFRYTFS